MNAKQIETYKKSLEIFDDKYENDDDFKAFADQDPQKALADVGITDIRAFVKFTCKHADKERMSDMEAGGISGGFGQPGFTPRGDLFTSVFGVKKDSPAVQTVTDWAKDPNNDPYADWDE